MYQKLNDRDLELIRIAEEKTLTDYEVSGNFIPVDSFMCIITDLVGEIGILEEKVEDYKEYKEQYCNLCDKLEKDL